MNLRLENWLRKRMLEDDSLNIHVKQEGGKFVAEVRNARLVARGDSSTSVSGAILLMCREWNRLWYELRAARGRCEGQ